MQLKMCVRYVIFRFVTSSVRKAIQFIYSVRFEFGPDCIRQKNGIEVILLLPTQV